MKSLREDIRLLVPSVDRDAAFALSWFNRPEGKQTLLSMGNALNEITESTLEGEESTIRDFLELEKNNQQITRMIVVEDKTIGAVWIELSENHGVQPPSVHIIIGDPEYRGKGIGSSVMQSAIDYAFKDLGTSTLYSRHLASNKAIATLNNKLGFREDGSVYVDDNGLVWQNIKLIIL